MPIVGFRDSAGREVTFAQVHEGQGDFHTLAGAAIPRPFLRALAKGYRSADHYGSDKAVSVTTLIAPVQATLLLQRHDVYVDPVTDGMWSTYGSIAHALFEDGAKDSDVIENKLVIERGGLEIGGTFDLLEERAKMEYSGRDYKVGSGYGVKSMLEKGVYHGKPDYFWQAQMYHLMTQDPDVMQILTHEDGSKTRIPWPLRGCKIVDWGLVAISRDWNARMASHYGPIEVIQVPLLELDRVENWLNQRLHVYKAAEMCSDEGMPSCSPEETWDGKRCAKWCPAAGFCHQNDPTLGLS